MQEDWSRVPPVSGVAKELSGTIKQIMRKERKQFDHPISFFQAVQFMLAEMATMVFNMESIVYRTATDMI